MLLGVERDLQVEQAEADGVAAFDARRVRDAPPEHLVAAADPQYGTACRGVRAHGVGEAGASQPVEVGDGGARAGEDDEVGVGEPGGLGHVPHGNARLARQRLGVGGVGDPRQPDDRHPQPLAPVRGRRAAEHPVGDGGERVLGVQPQPFGPRHDPVGRTSGERVELVEARLEERRIAAELVDDEARDATLVGRVEHRDRAEEVREHAAAVDVADHDDGQVSGLRQAHVGDVVGAQVDLGGRPRAFADDDVEPGPQVGEARR